MIQNGQSDTKWWPPFCDTKLAMIQNGPHGQVIQNGVSVGQNDFVIQNGQVIQNGGQVIQNGGQVIHLAKSDTKWWPSDHYKMVAK